jgi:DNA-binding transcriptional LysR family regulator
MAQKPLQEGKLVPILSDWACESFPLYIVYPQTRHLSNKVRVVVDWLAKRVQTLKVEENRMLMREAS